MKARAKVNRWTIFVFFTLIVAFILYEMYGVNDEVLKWVLPISIGIMASSITNALNVYTIEGDTMKYGMFFSRQQIPLSKIHKVEEKNIGIIGQILTGSPRAFYMVYYTKYDSFNLLLPLNHPMSQKVKEIAEGN